MLKKAVVLFFAVMFFLLQGTCLAFMPKEAEPVLSMQAVSADEKASVDVLVSRKPGQWRALYFHGQTAICRIKVANASFDKEKDELSVSVLVRRIVDGAPAESIDNFTLRQGETKDVTIDGVSVSYLFSAKAPQEGEAVIW